MKLIKKACLFGKRGIEISQKLNFRKKIGLYATTVTMNLTITKPGEQIKKFSFYTRSQKRVYCPTPFLY